MKSVLRLSLFVYLFCLFTAGFAAAQAQITTGVIQGSVLDPQGEALPGAQVEARNVDTNSCARRRPRATAASRSSSCRPAATR